VSPQSGAVVVVVVVVVVLAAAAVVVVQALALYLMASCDTSAENMTAAQKITSTTITRQSTTLRVYTNTADLYVKPIAEIRRITQCYLPPVTGEHTLL